MSSTASSAIKAVILAGPTASGKTELLDAVFGAGALRFSPGSMPEAQIISADSMQAYRGMDIGTAKPDADLLIRLPHHLIDMKNPDEQYTAGEFVRLADSLCGKMSAGGILPVVSGGTGFYLRSFICGPSSAPPASESIRIEVAEELKKNGAEALRKELAAADPVSAARIAVRDLYRLTRAVEILRATGCPPSSFAPSGAPRERYRFLVLGVERPREELNARIDARVDAMFAAGLPEEIERLRAAGYGPSSPGCAAIGYREFFAMEGASPDEVRRAVKLHTRQYAKRQMTFFRALPGIEWHRPDPAGIAAAVLAFLARP